MQAARSRRLHRRCRIAEICLKWALNSGQDAGVWGWMSEDE
ncbi:MAG TPA: WhiB family transcriptional regulator [Dermatophilaceae bacterium]|nr:WhiB family transcriptional regulator [Dermatophilaceae bacterium]